MSAENKINLLPGDYVFREGEFGQTAYIIETGTLELVKYTGEEHTVLTELEKGALFGEMAIIDNSARSASARAKTECVLRVVTEEELKKHLSSSPTASLEMMRRLASYVRTANERLTRDAFAEVDEDNTSDNSLPQTRLAMLTGTQSKRFANSTMKLMSLLIFRPKSRLQLQVRL